MNLFKLSSEKKRECLIGAIKAKYERKIKNPKNFYEWILSSFGKGIAKYFMFPYNEKLWKVDLKNITTEWLGKYVPRPSLEEIIEGALKPTLNIGYNVEFLYPKTGGIQQLSNSFLSYISNLKLNTEVKEINSSNKTLIAGDKTYSYDNLISTIPCPELIKIIEDVPPKILKSAKKLKYISVVIVWLGINRENISPYHWLYFPEKDKVFYRVCFFNNFSNQNVPKGMSGLGAEISFRDNLNLSSPQLIKRTIEDLKKCKILTSKDQILVKKVRVLKYACVIYDEFREKNLNRIKEFLEKNNIYSIGRYGNWEYSEMEKAILDGREIAKKLNQ